MGSVVVTWWGFKCPGTHPVLSAGTTGGTAATFRTPSGNTAHCSGSAFPISASRTHSEDTVAGRIFLVMVEGSIVPASRTPRRDMVVSDAGVLLSVSATPSGDAGGLQHEHQELHGALAVQHGKVQ